MVLFFTVTLVFSLCAMALLLAVKRYELSTGRVVFAGVRPKVGSFLDGTLRLGRYILPGLARHYIERAVRALVIKLHLWVARAILKLQNLLERVLQSMRTRTGHVDVNREPSGFLREVANHKKNLSYKDEDIVE